MYSLWNNVFHRINLTYGSTFSTVFIKQKKIKINQKIDFHVIQNNGWNTQILQILNEECDGIFYLSGNQLSRIQNPVELTHKCVSKVFKYQEPFVYAIFFYESE